MKKVIPTLIFAAFFLSWGQKNENIEQWDVFELTINGPSSGNPYMEVDLSVTFTSKGETLKVPGFYDGNGIYRVRFSPPRQGKWSYLTQSNASDLTGKKGKFSCVKPSGKNHGPVRVVNTYYLQYADGTPFYSVGTTAYQWTSVKQSIQDKTIETLGKAPFNKIRMCVFPKWYRYGNDTEPWIYPYKREGGKNDFTQPNYEFFQNFDRRVQQLLEMGIEADVILFHEYDKWGYFEMGHEMNERYVRYMIARISAYSNVWWSLANEWDIPRLKAAIDWEGIGTLLQREDPHQRLRGIHNWYGSEDHFYDHSRPWITHVSAQTSQFYNAIKWREQYKKPLLLDEMRYEGDVPSGWGNLTAQQMTSYFWMAGLSGGYGTHGDTFGNDSDGANEVRWWGKGGTLPGKSPERIRFFRTVMEQAPVTEMKPELIDNGDPAKLNNNIHVFAKPGEYYLVYVADANTNIKIDLPGNTDYNLDIIDTWNMKIVSSSTSKPGLYNYITKMPYTALKFQINRNK
jgi:hypothetical protein